MCVSSAPHNITIIVGMVDSQNACVEKRRASALIQTTDRDFCGQRIIADAKARESSVVTRACLRYHKGLYTLSAPVLTGWRRSGMLLAVAERSDIGHSGAALTPRPIIPLECSGFGNLLVRIRRVRIARQALGSTLRALPSVIPNAPECSPTIASPGALHRFSGPRRGARGAAMVALPRLREAPEATNSHVVPQSVTILASTSMALPLAPEPQRF
ncbi:hypothetical protein AG1IA_07082 [Rhizoctonia solani AG-1 IA]|uniref:Uncharacterized protein n=1 Tax=Thanatephorus cucumeris (strain AG1-IA) TaxID=983506 RepID=L8WL43_THACA|nr:hypothetical protein AG1IA_07082 [Rhizoctonia solani AG-1 IA]